MKIYPLKQRFKRSRIRIHGSKILIPHNKIRQFNISLIFYVGNMKEKLRRMNISKWSNFEKQIRFKIDLFVL